MTALRAKDLALICQIASRLTRLPVTKVISDYDAEVDCLYLSFRKPQDATDSHMRDDGIIVRRSGKEIVGLTILDASTRDEPAPSRPNGKTNGQRQTARARKRRASKKELSHE